MNEERDWGKIARIVVTVAFAVFVLAYMFRIDRTVKDFLQDPFGLGVRAIDTVNVGTGPNTGTGDPLRTAFLKINEAIKIMDSLDLELLTNEEMQSLKDVEDLADGLLFPASDTTVTAEVGKIVYRSSDATWYGCVRATPTTRWEPFN